MARTDHFHDPDAPAPTGIVIAVSVFVTDARDRLLMIRRTDNGLYALPGGTHELGETMTETAVRETGGRAVGGELRTSDESSEVGWIERDDLDVHPSIRLRIAHGYGRTEPYYT